MSQSQSKSEKIFQIMAHDMATHDTKIYSISTILREDDNHITVFTKAQQDQTMIHFILSDDLVEAIAHFTDKHVTRWAR